MTPNALALRQDLCGRLAMLPGDRTPVRRRIARKIGLLDQGRSSMTPAAAMEIAFDTFWLMEANLRRGY